MSLPHAIAYATMRKLSDTIAAVRDTMLIRAIAATETKTRHSICISTHFTLNTHPIKSHSLANRERATTKLTHTNSKEHIHNALIYDEHMCSRLAEMSKRYLW